MMRAQPCGQADAFERRIMRPLDDARVGQCREHLVGQSFATSEVDDAGIAAVNRVAEQQQLELRMRGIRIHAGLGEVDRAE